MLDDELEADIRESITVDVPFVMISAHAQKNIDTLKDKIWEKLN